MSILSKTLVAIAITAVAAAAVAAGLILTTSSTTSLATSKVWHVGSTWKLDVKKNAGLVAPDGKKAGYSDTWTFQVTAKPTKANPYWTVSAHLAGAEGTFAQGFRLLYTRTHANPDVFQIEKIALGGTAPQSFQLAEPLLGAGFPLQPRISGTPTASPVKTTGVPTAPPSVNLGKADSTGFAAGLGGTSLKNMPPRALKLPPGAGDQGPAALATAEHAAQH